MKRKFFFTVIMIAAVFCMISIAHAVTNLKADLRKAEKLLADKNYEHAFGEFIKYAEKGNPLSQFTIGLFYRNGWGMQKDPDKACRWFEKAALQNIPSAAHYHADCLLQGFGKFAPCPGDAVKWYAKASDLGHYISLCSLAEIYMSGMDGIPKDIPKAFNLLRQATLHNIPSAYLLMGKFYLMDDGHTRDFEKVFRYFQMAAEKNSAEGQYYLGLMFKNGLGRKKALGEAGYWLEKAASRGHVPAYFPTARHYFDSPVDPDTGLLSDRDLAKAYLWLSAAQKTSKNEDELVQVAEMLKKINTLMPGTWVPPLNKKLEEHLSAYPVQK